MKKTITQTCLQVCIVASFAVAIGCGTGSNSNESMSDTASMKTNNESKMQSTNNDSSTKTASDTSMKNDKTFVLEAAKGGMMEVEMGKLAITNASSSKVKEFGKMMVADHSKANAELKSIASTKNISIPEKADDETQQHLDAMMKMKGADFDKSYVSMMVNDHKGDLSKFETEASSGMDADVKAFASKTLPVLKKHMTSITAIDSEMKNKK